MSSLTLSENFTHEVDRKLEEFELTGSCYFTAEQFELTEKNMHL